MFTPQFPRIPCDFHSFSSSSCLLGNIIHSFHFDFVFFRKTFLCFWYLPLPLFPFYLPRLNFYHSLIFLFLISFAGRRRLYLLLTLFAAFLFSLLSSGTLYFR